MNIGIMLLLCLPFFILQLFLLKNTNKRALRMIPLYIVLLELVAAVLTYNGVFGKGIAVMSHELLAVVMIFAALAFIGAILLAWAVWWIENMFRGDK